MVKPIYLRVCVCVFIAGIFCAGFASQASSHGVFKLTLESEVEELRVTCFACHVKKEPKTIRNEFGELFFKEFKGMELSSKWQEAENDAEARKKFEEEVMAPAFIKALKKIGEKEHESGEKYLDLITEGKIEGTKLR